MATTVPASARLAGNADSAPAVPGTRPRHPSNCHTFRTENSRLRYPRSGERPWGHRAHLPPINAGENGWDFTCRSVLEWDHGEQRDIDAAAKLLDVCLFSQAPWRRGLIDDNPCH